ncbi:MAG: kynureninase [Bacteroidales bacterium]|nr:kynureninase [Bacteroidales bacterium]
MEKEKNLHKAAGLDRTDPLARFRKRFHIPENTIYVDGNSLGLLSKDAEATLLRVLNEWKTLGINAWLEARSPWFYVAEETGRKAAHLVGAEENELIFTGTTTINIHSIISTFYNPVGKRTKILADELNFPSDLYALKSQIKLKGYDPERELLLAPGINGKTLDEDLIVSMMTEEVALVWLSSVLYGSGQLLDMEYLTQQARKRDILIGFDCSHSAGAIPHQFSKWGVDFATFCSYKYLNGGPGCSAFLYLNKKHFSHEPALAGWFGYIKEKQFDMLPDFEHAKSAGGWQISSPGILGSAGMEGSLHIIAEAGIERIRKKSLSLTSFFVELITPMLGDSGYGFSIDTPLENHRRGGHIALSHPTEALRITQALKARQIIPDFRAPDIIRIAPVALYNTYEEVWQVAQALDKIMQQKEYLNYDNKRKPIS